MVKKKLFTTAPAVMGITTHPPLARALELGIAAMKLKINCQLDTGLARIYGAVKAKTLSLTRQTEKVNTKKGRHNASLSCF